MRKFNHGLVHTFVRMHVLPVSYILCFSSVLVALYSWFYTPYYKVPTALLSLVTPPDPKLNLHESILPPLVSTSIGDYVHCFITPSRMFDLQK